MLKNKKTTRTSKKGFRTKDFAVKDFSALAVASYTTVFEDNGSNLTTSIAYGTSSSLLTEQISATFSPTSGISSVDIYAPALSGDTTYFGAISSNQTFPYTLLNDGFGNSQVVTIGVVYNNTRLHSANEIESVRFVASLSGASLYATASGDSINPSLTGSVLNSSSYGALTAVGDAVAPSGITLFRTTPFINGLNIYWTDPTDSDLSAIQIKFSTVSAVSARNEGTLLANVAAGIQSTQHYPLTANTVYYYSAFSQDNVNKWSTIAVSAYGVPIDNDIAGAFSWETTQQTRARYIVEGII